MLPFVLIAGIAYGVSYWICSTGAPVWRAIVGFLIAFLAGWFFGVGIAVFLLSTFSNADTATTTFNLLKNGIAWALIGSSFGVYHGRKKLRTNCTLTQSPIPTPTQISPIDNALYAAALSEIEEGRLDKGVWARSFADSGGDEAKAKATYIRIRAEAIGLNAVWKNTQPHAVGNAETDVQDVPQPTGIFRTHSRTCDRIFLSTFFFPSWRENIAAWLIVIVAVFAWLWYQQNDTKRQTEAASPVQLPDAQTNPYDDPNYGKGEQEYLIANGVAGNQNVEDVVAWGRAMVAARTTNEQQRQTAHNFAIQWQYQFETKNADSPERALFNGYNVVLRSMETDHMLCFPDETRDGGLTRQGSTVLPHRKCYRIHTN